MDDSSGLSLLKIGVVVRPEGTAPDSMEGFARILQGQGFAVRGLVQRHSNNAALCPCTEILADIETGRTYRLSQDPGTGTPCCQADTRAEAEASLILRRALETKTDLLIVSKFGRQEAQGLGMVDEFLNAVSQGIPLLTSVEVPLLSRWREFSGGLAEELNPGCGSLMRWWDKIRPRGVPRLA